MDITQVISCIVDSHRNNNPVSLKKYAEQLTKMANVAIENRLADTGKSKAILVGNITNMMCSEVYHNLNLRISLMEEPKEKLQAVAEVLVRAIQERGAFALVPTEFLPKNTDTK